MDGFNNLERKLSLLTYSSRKTILRPKKDYLMKLSESVKSISYLKANAAELISKINEQQGTYVITQNGEAKVVVQDIKLYEKTQDTLAMLKLLAMTADKNKKAKGIKDTFNDLRKEINNLQ